MEIENVIVCRMPGGIELRCNLLHLSRYEASFEVYNPEVTLQVSQVLEKFQVYLNQALAYSGRATVKGLANLGLRMVCEVILEDFWIDLDFSVVSSPRHIQKEFQSFLNVWENTFRIEPEYKAIVANIQTFLAELKIWSDQVELAVRSSPSKDTLELEKELIEHLGVKALPVLDRLFDEYERVAARVEAPWQAIHRNYTKRQLHPAVLCAPFVYRTYFKPLGYAGDYEMVDMIARQPMKGGSLYAKLVNLWFLSQSPAVAHRNRLLYLARRLREQAVQASSRSQTLRVLNLGCGPAVEIQDFLRSEELNIPVSLSLLDFNDETLAHVKSVLEAIKRQYHRRDTLRYIKKSVQQILKESGKAGVRSEDQKYDFVYVAGLFDYLSDQVCQRLIEVLFHWLSSKGTLLVTNVDNSNPRRQTMEALLDWHLIYRNANRVQRLIPDSIPTDQAVIQSETSGVNIILEITNSRIH